MTCEKSASHSRRDSGVTSVRSARVTASIRDNGFGLRGKGCVGEATSPGTSLAGTGRSSTPKTGSPGRSIEHEHQSHLRHLDDSRDQAAVAANVGEDWLRRRIEVPEVVMNELRVPAAPAGRGIERHERSPEQVARRDDRRRRSRTTASRSEERRARARRRRSSPTTRWRQCAAASRRPARCHGRTLLDEARCGTATVRVRFSRRRRGRRLPARAARLPAPARLRSRGRGKSPAATSSHTPRPAEHRRLARRSMLPLVPKPFAGLPVAASSAISRPSQVPEKTVRAPVRSVARSRPECDAAMRFVAPRRGACLRVETPDLLTGIAVESDDDAGGSGDVKAAVGEYRSRPGRRARRGRVQVRGRR